MILCVRKAQAMPLPKKQLQKESAMSKALADALTDMMSQSRLSGLVTCSWPVPDR